LIASSCHNSYSAVILLTPSIQYVLGSDIRTPDDKNNGSPEDDNNDSSPRDGNNEEDGEDRDTDPGGNLVAKERGGDEEDPADVDERGVEEDREDPSDIDEREGIRRIEDVPLDGIDNSSETEDIDKGDIADPQTICLGYYQQQNGIKEIEDNTGALTLKKISANTRELIPGGLFRITPNPYGLDSPLIVSDDGNTENFDCSPVDDGKIVLGQVPFSSYNIQEIQHPSIDFLVIHEADISIHENLANPIINFIERSFTFPSSTAMAVDNNRLRTIPNQYIINLKDNAEEGKLVAEEFANRGAEIIQVYEDSSVFRGFTINVNKNRELLNEMTNDSRVNYIEQDKMGQLASMTGNSMPSTDTNRIYETIPKGIDRIDSDLNGIFFEVNNTRNSVKNQNIYGNDNGYGNINGGISGNQINPQDVDVDIAILDTGVSFAHPDLNVYQGASFINGVKTADDDNGHGSHIAGTAAGKNNSLGVIGTAPGASCGLSKFVIDWVIVQYLPR
jgi:subtilase family protein